MMMRHRPRLGRIRMQALLLLFPLLLIMQRRINGAELEVELGTAGGTEDSFVVDEQPQSGRRILQQQQEQVISATHPDPTTGLLQCSLYIFAPFTNQGNATRSISSAGEKQTERSNNNNPAFTVLAAALLAAEHFNARDASVVPQLRGGDSAQECAAGVRIDWDRSVAFDTGTVGHAAARQFFRQQRLSLLHDRGGGGQTTTPCAIAGPLSDRPAVDLSVLALGAQIPMVAAQSHNQRVVLDDLAPYTSLVFPDAIDSAAQAVSALVDARGRTDYVSVVYTLSDTNIQRRETIAWALEQRNVTYETHAASVLKDGQGMRAKDNKILRREQNLKNARAALQSVKDRGFRTIILCLDNALLEFPPFVEAADELGMNRGDYFWYWFGAGVDPVHFLSNDPKYQKILRGSAMLLPMENFWLVDEAQHSDSITNNQLDASFRSDPFLDAWRSADASIVDRLNAMNPIAPGEVGYVFAEPDFFQTNKPDWGAGFMYDAVMSIGLGACRASARGAPNGTLTGAAHLRGIRGANFTGATGRVQFVNAEGRSGARVASTVTYGVANLVPSLADEGLSPFRISDIRYPDATRWIALNPFVYADRRTVPPEDLRDQPKQNHIHAALKGLGLGLMSTVFLAGLATIVWVFVHRKHRVLAASQPLFLYTLAFGCMLEASAIFTRSFDEANGWSESALSAMCVATPWLISIGHMIVYGSLFSKLWRVNKVLSFARRKIDVKQVAWPCAVLMVAALVLLSYWTAVDTPTWVRTELVEYTGESIGACKNDHRGIYISVMSIILVIPILLTLVMAWKTKDISDEFSEAKWVWILVIVQVEVMLVAVPTVIILQDVSADGRYLGMTFVLWVYPMSTLLLIMTPKLLAYWRATGVWGSEIKVKRRGAEIGSVRVSGLPLVTVVGIQNESSPLPSSLRQEVSSESSGVAADGRCSSLTSVGVRPTEALSSLTETKEDGSSDDRASDLPDDEYRKLVYGITDGNNASATTTTTGTPRL